MAISRSKKSSQIKKWVEKSPKAFTILELLVVIAVIGILATITIVSYSSIQANSRNTQRSSRIKIISEALEKYYQQYGEYPSCAIMTAAPSVVTNALKNLDPNVLATPTDSQGTNSFACIDPTTDKFAYIGGGTKYTLEYKEEETGSIISLDNRKHSYVVDNYSEANYTTSDNHIFNSGSPTAFGQSFTGTNGLVVSSKFMLSKFGSPTGSAYSKIYAHSGTFGTNGIPTGAALATSDTINVSSITTSPQLVTFSFTGANRIALVNGTHYVVTVEYSGGTDSNYVQVGEDATSPNHAGNLSWFNESSWFPDNYNDFDLIFYVNAVSL